MSKERKKIECDICGKIMIQGTAKKRLYNKYCSCCRKFVKNKKETLTWGN
jgi:late competence protein required for DNA uptake (superfamily II DNA/RNA helicase)